MANYAGSLKFDTKVDSTGFQQGISRIGTIVKGVVAGYTGKALVDYFIGSNARMETYITSFETMLGSAEKAKKLMSDLKDFASVTPFETSDLANATQTLLAFGVQLEDVQGNLQMLGDISQGNSEKLKSLSVVFGQIKSAGRLMGQDLLQLINVGFNPLQVISEKTGRSMAELKDDMEKGKISFEMVSDAMKTATSEGGLFYQSMEKQSKTMNGMLSTLKDSFVEFGRVAGEEAFEEVKNTLDELLNAIERASQDGTLEEIAEDVGNALSTIVKGLIDVIKFVWEYKEAIMAGVSAMVAFNIAMKAYSAFMVVVEAYKKLKVALETATVAQLAFNTALKVNPIGLVISAVLALATAIGVFSFATGGAKSEVDEYNESMKRAREQGKDIIAQGKSEISQLKAKAEKYEELRKKVDKTIEEKEQLKNLAIDLNNVIPNTVTMINGEITAYNNLEGAIDGVCESMRKQSLLRSRQAEYDEAVAYNDKINIHELEQKKQAYENIPKSALDDITKGQQNTLFGAAQLNPFKVVSGVSKLKDNEKYGTAYDDWNNSKKIDGKKVSAKEQYELYQENEKIIEEVNKLLTDSYKPENNQNNNAPDPFIENEKANLGDFKSIAEDLKQRRNVNLISEKQYYSKLKDALVAGNHDKLGEYNEYWAEVIKYQEGANSKALSTQETANSKAKAEQEKANAELLESQKKTFDEWSAEINALTDEYTKAFNEIATKRENLQNKLASFGSLFSRETVENETKVILTDFDKVTSKLREYQQNLQQLKSYGASASFMQEVTAMGVDDGLEFSKALLSQSQFTVSEYLSDWENNQKVAQEIANDYYQDEINNLQTMYVDKFNAVLKTMPKEAQVMGADTLQGFVNGLQSKADTVNSESENLMNGVIAVCKNALGIHSPSREFKALGEYAAEGFIQGIEGKADDLYSRLKEVFGNSISKVFNELQAQVNAENGRLAQSLLANSPTYISDNNDKSGNTFIQNVYSPKAISPYEAGRQARQMFQLASLGR